MTKEFQVYYDPNPLHGFHYYLGFESLIKPERLVFNKSIKKQRDYDPEYFFCFRIDWKRKWNSDCSNCSVSLNPSSLKFRFYLQNYMVGSISDENPGLVITNCNLLPDKSKLIKDTNLNFDLTKSTLFPKIREELLKINQLDRLK